jgi:6-phosphogluconolactonase
MYTVDATSGVLTANPDILLSTGNRPSWVAVDPSSRFAYAVNRFDDTVSMYTIDPTTGALTANVPATVGTGNAPFSIVVNKSRTFAYVANQGGSVSIYKIENNSVLAPAGTAATGKNPIVIALTN